MAQNPDNFTSREYSSQPSRSDYANPDYYRQAATWQRSVDLPAVDASQHDVNAVEDPYMYEYRKPQSLAGYTTYPGVEQQVQEAKIEQSDQAQSQSKKRKGLAGIGGAIAAIIASLSKLGSLGFLLKFGWAGISALISIAVYSWLFGWRFAIGLVTLLFIHEMGHALVMKLKGIPIGGLTFIPLLGAAVTMRRMPQNARDEAEVGIAGPIAGAVACAFCLLFAYMPMADQIWAPLAYFGFFINLFNLIPIVPFDGGRVLAAIDRRVWILGFVGLLGFQIWEWLNGNFSFWLLFFVIIAFTQLWSRGAAAKTLQGQSYYDVPLLTRITMSLLYFGLAVVLYLGMTTAHGLIPTIQ